MEAVEDAFGSEIDYAMLIKLYGTDPEAERRFSPPVVIAETKRQPAVVSLALRCTLHYDAAMRTTIDLPSDIHNVVSSVARDRGESLSRTVAALLRQALMPGPTSTRIRIDPRTGLKVITLGRTVTSEDVKSLDDDD